jgi:hypothetical protein
VVGVGKSSKCRIHSRFPRFSAKKNVKYLTCWLHVEMIIVCIFD